MTCPVCDDIEGGWGCTLDGKEMQHSFKELDFLRVETIAMEEK